MTDNKLKSMIERVERLIEERKGIGDDIRDIFTEAKSAGYVPKAMRKVIARRAMNASDLAEEDALIEAYEAAAGAAGVAARMVAAGATIDEAAAKTGVPRSTVGFLKAPAKIQQSKNLDAKTAELDTQPGSELGTAEHEASPALAPARLCGCEKCCDNRRTQMIAAGAPFHLTARGPQMPGWRYSCEICGNKRCPHHADHAFACTSSNEPGQIGAPAPASNWRAEPAAPATNQEEARQGEKGCGPDLSTGCASDLSAKLACDPPTSSGHACPSTPPQRESCSTEQPPTKSEMGAVAEPSSAERVASPNPDDDKLEFPPFLKRERVTA